MDIYRMAAEELAHLIISKKISNRKQLDSEKKRISLKYGLKGVLKNSEILACIPKSKRTKEIIDLLKIRKTRTISGIAIIAVMTRPKKCPKKEPCIYCPGGEWLQTPQSYIGKEPAALRAIQFNFDAFYQVKHRIQQLEAIGHATDKVEIVVMGGTFTAEDEEYQNWFVKRIFDALNGKEAENLFQAKKMNEKAGHRCIGMVIETRPDWCFEPQIKKMLEFGATRVELGVQHPDDEIYSLVRREHTVYDVVKSTQLLKDSAFKIAYHLMPGLPGSNPKKDVQMFRGIFEDSRFKPDMLKIYPCLLVKPEFLPKGENSEIFQLYKTKKWIPYDTETAAEVIAKAKQYFPRWVRVMRIERDIPTQYILAGVKSSNLRQIVHKKLKEMQARCNCIRCREIGFVKEPDFGNIHLHRMDYEASNGKEIFLSFDDDTNDAIVAFLRLRFPYKPFVDPLTNRTALVRELHVYGPALRLSERARKELQHRGFGRRLLERAEGIARDRGYESIAIISGVGVRDYYRRFGYSLQGPYMCKNL